MVTCENSKIQNKMNEENNKKNLRYLFKRKGRDGGVGSNVNNLF